jgi:hypothetical protein
MSNAIPLADDTEPVNDPVNDPVALASPENEPVNDPVKLPDLAPDTNKSVPSTKSISDPE